MKVNRTVFIDGYQSPTFNATGMKKKLKIRGGGGGGGCYVDHIHSYINRASYINRLIGQSNKMYIDRINGKVIITRRVLFCNNP